MQDPTEITLAKTIRRLETLLIELDIARARERAALKEIAEGDPGQWGHIAHDALHAPRPPPPKY